MTQDEIIHMAREAGFLVDNALFRESVNLFERFAALVAAHERNRHAWTQEHWTQYEHAIAAAEREACAKVCDKYAEESSNPMNFAENCAAAIRARGQ